MNSNPTFQHRHYCRIARIIADLPEGQRESVAKHFARELRGTNPAYSEYRFETAANGQPQGRDK